LDLSLPVFQASLVTFNRAIEMSQSWHRALGMLGDLFMKYLEADAVTLLKRAGMVG